ncbi:MULTISPECIES: cytochrome b [unclassified Rhizobium]|jgi:cytochrome b561|uniref:cytochrome b n=1 Tax=unclassified Rhizobium TaxID=2613769 RepID=UPI002167579D|nr:MULTISPECIES: cytochrome b/b6 domain-containing protein [unclassified Rhizobium]MCS3739486.1 cytochrome b561 [Rhizobium sp. BK661]MCS4091307.1 cytochrome b561 [Rhizobium sp. BK176]
MQSAPVDAYSLPQRLLHWGMALLIFFNLLFPDGMNEWHRAMRRTGIATADQVAAANIHAYVGIAILALAIIRVCLRFSQGAPIEIAGEPAIFRLAAKVVHFGLYAFIFVMPLTGIAAYYFGMDAVGSLHADVLKVVLWVFVAAHVAGALVHQFYWKTNVLKRMTVGR